MPNSVRFYIWIFQYFPNAILWEIQIDIPYRYRNANCTTVPAFRWKNVQYVLYGMALNRATFCTSGGRMKLPLFFALYAMKTVKSSASIWEWWEIDSDISALFQIGKVGRCHDRNSNESKQRKNWTDVSLGNAAAAVSNWKPTLLRCNIKCVWNPMALIKFYNQSRDFILYSIISFFIQLFHWFDDESEFLGKQIQQGLVYLPTYSDLLVWQNLLITSATARQHWLQSALNEIESNIWLIEFKIN